MSRVVVFNNLTLDGVMQAPGRPDEDRRGGFQFGGWATPYADEVLGKVAGERMAKAAGQQAPGQGVRDAAVRKARELKITKIDVAKV